MALRPWLLVGIVGCAAAPAESTPEITSSATMLVTDRGGDRVIAYRSDGARIGTLIDRTHCDIDRPSSTRVGPDGRLYVASFGNNRVLRFEPDGSGDELFFGDHSLEEPVELVFDGSSLYVLGNDTRSVAVVDAAGGLLRSFGYPALRDAHDFAFGPDDMLYVCTGPSGHAEGVVQVWDPLEGVMLRSFAKSDEVELATSIAFDGARAYVSDYWRGRIVTFDATTGERLEELPHAFQGPIGIELGPDHRLYVVDRTGVWAVTAETAALVVDGADLQAPRSVTFVD